MKYTAEQIRNERISIECDNRAQVLQLQAHFHKLYPNDGYRKPCTSAGEGDKLFVQFYFPITPNGFSPFTIQRQSFLLEGMPFGSNKEIHFNDFDFEESCFKTGDQVICTDGYDGKLTNGKVYEVNATRLRWVSLTDDFGDERDCHEKRFVPASAVGANIEAGDTVMCVHDTGLLGLTSGKTYEVLEINNVKDILISGNEGRQTWYSAQRFVVVKKAAEVKLENTPFTVGEIYVGEWKIMGKNCRVIFKPTSADNSTECPFINDIGTFMTDRCCRRKDIKFRKARPEEAQWLSNMIALKAMEELQEAAPTQRSILQEAEELINGERAADYGKVSDNFANIAAGWNIIAKDGITPRKVGLMMAWVKICRDLVNPKHDNLVDGAGYFGCIDKMERE